MRILTLLLLAAAVTMANDGAASTAAGGIQLGHEERISLEKERLTISVSKIIVEYEFLNETDKDVSTEVAFPAGVRGHQPGQRSCPKNRGFSCLGGRARDSVSN